MDFEREIYLDHAAATPLDARVKAAMEPFEAENFFNPSAPYAPAWDVRHAFEAARADLAHAIGAKPAEVVITAGATESVNLAFGAIEAIGDGSLWREPSDDDFTSSPAEPKRTAPVASRREMINSAGYNSSIFACENDEAVPGSHLSFPNKYTRGTTCEAEGPLVVTTPIEHSAVLECAKARPHAFVPVNHHGLVDPEAVRAAITPATRLVSIGLANNEIGTVQPLRAISQVVQEVRQERLLAGNTTPLYLHSDASQCAGQLDVNVSTLGVDMLTLNAAKIYGPKQVGLLWCARGVALSPLVLGGGQERGLRSGTENVAGAVGFAKALQIAVESRKEEAVCLAALRDSLQHSLVKEFSDAVVSGHKKHRLPGLLHISFPGLDAERLVYLLEERGVYVATGAACAANKAMRSHVLEAIGLPPEVADGSLRLTLGRLSTEENTARAAEVLIETIRSEYERLAK